MAASRRQPSSSLRWTILLSVASRFLNMFPACRPRRFRWQALRSRSRSLRNCCVADIDSEGSGIRLRLACRLPREIEKTVAQPRTKPGSPSIWLCRNQRRSRCDARIVDSFDHGRFTRPLRSDMPLAPAWMNRPVDADGVFRNGLHGNCHPSK